MDTGNKSRDPMDDAVLRLIKEEELNQREPNKFQRGWNRLPLPIKAKVVIVDQGSPAVGLSAIQLNALGVGNGIVRRRYGDRQCEAKTWNAFGGNSLNDYEGIRITDTVAKKLNCSEGDEIEFIEVIARNFPIRVD
ncbi:MAG TPA: hypothetical protein VNG29_00130 [Candidatus Paceibacterota bacterium]|nr:hypothetical protein [Candidatus Paceibacterota bacterium]